jgi:exodeoxyribonuclease VII small subunit
MEKKKLKFEEALKQLEEIVEKLESDSIELEEAAELFEKGTKLSNFCQAKLEETKRKIEIVKTNENGEKILKNFEEDENSNGE